jgi:heme/copper-type cytochrome/quinol oxidase subunit 3
VSATTSALEHTPRASRNRETGWWGMMLFIATEATLFGTLFATYFYLRFKSMPVWPPDGIKPPELSLPLIMTVILLSSSLPMFLAEAGSKRGRMGWVKVGLMLTFVLGSVFLGLQLGVEYPMKLKEFTPQTDAYGSLFFTITAFHASHVLVGLLMNVWTQVKVYRGRVTQHQRLTLENAAIYWHFVDAIWIVVLATIYLSPKL